MCFGDEALLAVGRRATLSSAKVELIFERASENGCGVVAGTGTTGCGGF